MSISVWKVMAEFIVKGEVEPGYEPVKERFVKHFKDGLEVAAQLCVYVKGQKVIDLWGARLEDSGRVLYDYGPTTIASARKMYYSDLGFLQFVIAVLVDRGHLRYDQPIHEIWPEFGCHGKESTTLRTLLRHEAGLPRLNGTVYAADCTTERLRQGALSKFISDQVPLTPPGSRQAYHAISRGWILNEVVRRVDPKGRTIGEFLREDIAHPLGLQAELHLGLTSENLPHIAPLTAEYSWRMYPEFLMPGLLGGRFADVPLSKRLLWFFTGPLLARIFISGEPEFRVQQQAKEESQASADEEALLGLEELFNLPEARAAECPSSNMHCSARALALLATIVVERGNVPGLPKVMSKEGADEAMAGADPGKMCFGWLPNALGVPSSFTNAGWNMFKEARNDYTGWMGYGGSVMQWHEEERIGVGYTLTGLEPPVQNGWKGEVLQAEILKCAKAKAHRATSKY